MPLCLPMDGHLQCPLMNNSAVILYLEVFAKTYWRLTRSKLIKLTQ